MDPKDSPWDKISCPFRAKPNKLHHVEKKEILKQVQDDKLEAG